MSECRISDTVEVTTEVAGDDEEVDRPADAFGDSLSGNFYFDLARARFTFGFEVYAVTSRLLISCCDFNLIRIDLMYAIGSRLILLVCALLSLCRMFEDQKNDQVAFV
ncbi:hypothetical protein F2Q69_00058576 [Brassica cretica]|uniref:Uncharacterized protein n=1 Tax=Brassica cretica TaxID=69181 RepID=A0A8S9RM85_BRACR|nr:hypothetical protein F2Q69_00058576 [Brassica cretica]